MKPIRKIIPMLMHTPILVHNNKIITDRGDYNGYLAIPSELFDKIVLPEDKDNPYLMAYDRIPDIGVYPHGYWTFCATADLNDLNNFIPLLDIRKIDTSNYTIIGFDTCHFGDNPNIWNAKTVREHTFELYDALIDYIKINKSVKSIY